MLLLAGVIPIRAQEVAAPPATTPQQAYKVGTITVKFIGTAIVNEQVVRANMQLREGGDYDGSTVDRDIRALYKTGLFEFIEVKQEAAGPSVFNLVVEVTPKFRVLAIRYEGNRQIKSRRLEKEVKTKPNQALDDRQVKEDSEKIREYYQKSGYNQVSVNYTIERDRATSFGTVVFKIKEGAKVKIALVKFTGNSHIKSKKLIGEMETKKWNIFSWLTDTGRFKDDKFDEDLDKLRDYYREQGYLDVEIAQNRIVFDYPNPTRLIITINVNEGRRYRIGEISVINSKLHPEALLKRVLRQKSGMVFVPSKVEKDKERLEEFYGRDGYLETVARLIRKSNITTGNIDLVYDINESTKFNVESIVIQGNTKTKSTVILRELTLFPGDVFSTISMKISKLRLENTRFFEDVSMTPQETNIPGRRNLRIAVKEGRTGNLTFGAGFSSLERATVFAEVSQSNFDIFNRRSLFQGDGQKFKLRLQVGSVSSDLLLSFEEPWVFQRQLAVGFQLFRQSAEYTSTYYTQVVTGMEVYGRKRLFELVTGRLSYVYQIISIDNVSSGASTVISSLAGDNKVSKIGFAIERDTRDKIINTTSGNYLNVSTDLAGGPFGGDDNFYRVEVKGSQFFPVFETQAQVLALLVRGGVIQNYGNSSDVAYYNKFYLGGPDDLRGFEYHTVSPRDTFGEPIGGKTYGFFSAEYSFDIVSPIRFAFFYDAGFVNAGAYQFAATKFADNFGFGLRLFVAGSPLRLDFGIPLTGDSLSKKGNQFNFSFGTRY
ncbi:MAG: outer membrane protein assembly complex, YaeT protein [Verrucomicrobia bacterium]|nr:outer membrane protein assembly complex, YaeT protein [Verrucomicrobiota bacterium]